MLSDPLFVNKKHRGKSQHTNIAAMCTDPSCGMNYITYCQWEVASGCWREGFS